VSSRGSERCREGYLAERSGDGDAAHGHELPKVELKPYTEYEEYHADFSKLCDKRGPSNAFAPRNAAHGMWTRRALTIWESAPLLILVHRERTVA
jgi:hypothetical protein